jgi:hypothetical protein
MAADAVRLFKAWTIDCSTLGQSGAATSSAAGRSRNGRSSERMARPLLSVGLMLSLAFGLSAAIPSVTWAVSPAAEAMFQEGRRLMAEGQTAEACARFAGSLAIEASSGTFLNLAHCHEEQGKTATAWAEYRAAARLARSQGREDRARVADEKVTAIEPRLARLTAIAEKPAPGEAIATEEGTLGEGAIGVAVPIDPGTHTLTVTAPGRRPWSATIDVAEAEQRTLEIPALEEELVVVAPPPVGPPAAMVRAPAEAIPSRSSPRKPVRLDAYLAAGAGTFLAAGAGLWSVAYLKFGEAQTLCNTLPGCSDSERQDHVSTIETLQWTAAGSWVAAGGLAIAAGARLWLSKTAGDDSSAPDDVAGAWRSNLRLTRRILFVGSGASLLASAGFGLYALAKKHDYESDATCAYNCPALASAHQAADVSTGFAVAGATLGIAGAATLLYRPAANDNGARSGHDLAVLVGDRQLAVAGRF